MTAAEAVRVLREALPSVMDAHPDLALAGSTLIDHVLGLEQALDLIRSGVTSALRGAPENAVLGVLTRRRL
jgi:hypothetical protein